MTLDQAARATLAEALALYILEHQGTSHDYDADDDPMGQDGAIDLARELGVADELRIVLSERLLRRREELQENADEHSRLEREITMRLRVDAELGEGTR